MSRLEVVCGGMYSGKSTELIRRLERQQIAGRSVVAFKPAIDTRYEADAIATHSGQKVPCFLVDSFHAIPELADKFDVLAIDEAMLFPLVELEVIDRIVDNHYLTIASGLDMTYRQEPFGMMPYLMAVADDVTKLKAVCHKCGQDAKYTQRLVEGNPAPFNGPTIEIGALESYEARCSECFESA
jgi:thymidine kinase